MKTSSTNHLENKVVVITGASSGAGRAAALEFARKQATLVLASRNEAALQGMAEECVALGARVQVVRTDVTQAESVQRLAEAAVAFGGKLDVWVNNAGVLAVGEFASTPVEIHAQVIRTNLIGYLYGAHAAIPIFIQQGHGVLINNISVGGWFPVPYGTGYSASKFGLRGFSQALRGELRGYRNIHVCDLYPAFLDTPGIQHAANYTGAALKPAPPVYDPLRVGRAMVRLAMRPQSSKMVGSLAPLIKMTHLFFPVLSRNIMAGLMSTYFKNADRSPATEGNLFKPLEFGTSIHGGWNSPADIAIRKKAVLTAACFVAGFAGALLFSRKG